MSWEQRNADFCKAQTDAQLTYIEAERRVAELEEQNAKLRDELSKWERLTAGIDLPEHPVTQFKPKDLERKKDERIAELEQENAKLRDEFRKMDEWHSKELTAAMAENAKLREVVRDMWSAYHDGAANKEFRALPDRLRELGVDA